MSYLLNLLRLFLWLIPTSSLVSSSVFPNYHGQFEFVSCDTSKSLDKLSKDSKWWQTATFYQIYPRSFKDSNGDGVGDLNGITEQLPYLKEIGVTATWLSPIFTSPMADFGYDISNFTEIDAIFGSMDDFDRLISQANQLQIKILLDFVPNHSSDECLWFKKSIERDPYYKDFYVWHPGRIVNGVRQPPTNWLSVFRGSAWTWHDTRKEYYFHQFLKKQPDLNYRHPNVQETMKNILRFWLKKGVAGFRIDAVPHIFEVAAKGSQQELPDEPRADNSEQDPENYAYLKHIYTVDQPETLTMLYEWRKVLDDYRQDFGGDERVLMAETYSPLSIVMQYYGNETAEGAQIPFNFLLISSLTNNSNAIDYANIINTWLNQMPKGRTANWVLGNHDKSRIGSRLGTDRINMMNMLLNMLPGCSITYQGEEIGMTDVWISWNDTVDPSACNSNPKIYQLFSRDPERTPFQWTDGHQAGFSSANKTWLPLATNYRSINVLKERNNSLSHFNIYKALKDLKQEPTLKFGETTVKSVNRNVLGVKRFLLNSETFLLLMNIFDNREAVDLVSVFGKLPEEMICSMATNQSTIKPGDRVRLTGLSLGPKEAIILKSITKLSTTAGYFTYYLPEVNHLL